ncbi:DUF979 domain-containing protein [Novosphingobium malaysiense]|uniref:Membrane protein n=1 Tax=Novosphingobium malaysiense TaxID=1348853 RepID=A0A0B1ZQK9_9SPHN|nr:DUF979 domain-containing protein [Novosphingobium malaysiense]KHK93430.1 membrane protein [Novosphingobium malaysiense]
MIGLGFLYLVAGVTFASFSLLSVTQVPRRPGNALFYALIAVSFLLGDRLGDFGNGVLVLAIVAVATLGRMGFRDRTQQPVEPRGPMLFVPALVIPVTALAGTFAFAEVPGFVDPKQVTLVSLTLGVILSLLICFAWLRPAPAEPFRQGTRLMDHIGWAAILPQMLASLGAVFALAGMGDIVGTLIGHIIPSGSILGAVVVYCLGMALFTVIMGNAFAAFPVMLTAIGLPLLIHTYGGAPARVAAIGMLAGFCGTLVTPMAANFNLVPAALLELRDRYGVIRAQVPTAIPLLLFNIALLYLVM